MENSIKSERAKKNITQEELAKKVKVSRQTINAIEKGKTDPKLSIGINIAKILKKKVEEIFEYEN